RSSCRISDGQERSVAWRSRSSGRKDQGAHVLRSRARCSSGGDVSDIPPTVTTPDGAVRSLEIYPVGIFRDIKISFRRRKYCLHLGDILSDAEKGDWRGVR